ncbi:MAG: hypothetical protein KDE47_00685 [Caldilineaceae bacterium]|nr:hypothetical protein [Caldilineaceae bacterium]
MSEKQEQAQESTKFERRTVAADLVEATPGGNGIGYWILASPMLLFLLWMWVDFIHLLSPLENRFLNVFIGTLIFIGLIILPLGLLAHRLILLFPRIFQNAGWDVQPLEPVREEEMYVVRYQFQARHWANNSWPRAWLRAAQGWVYLEITAIFVGAIVMIPLFFSAVEYGFGQ